MLSNTSDLNLKLKVDGYVKVPLPNIIPKLKIIKKDVFNTFSFISEKNNGPIIINDKDIIDFHFRNKKLQYKTIKLLQYCSSIISLSGDKIFLNLLKKIGFIYPHLEIFPNFRCDMIIKDQSLFKSHQDYSFNKGSKNSITFWIPLQDTSINEGALKIVPGTHKLGLLKNKRGILKSSELFNFISCPVDFGEVLIFNQKLVHKSAHNKSNNIRFSDLGCKEYQSKSYNINHTLIIKSFKKK
ncbi:MAG: hypothetical protein CBE24_02080 [bacterium TMED264]|nr:MAG: hypothetical protein CBE24_02080 [bacterium TMED264]